MSKRTQPAVHPVLALTWQRFLCSDCRQTQAQHSETVSEFASIGLLDVLFRSHAARILDSRFSKSLVSHPQELPGTIHCPSPGRDSSALGGLSPGS